MTTTTRPTSRPLPVLAERTVGEVVVSQRALVVGVLQLDPDRIRGDNERFITVAVRSVDGIGVAVRLGPSRVRAAVTLLQRASLLAWGDELEARRGAPSARPQAVEHAEPPPEQIATRIVVATGIYVPGVPELRGKYATPPALKPIKTYGAHRRRARLS